MSFDLSRLIDRLEPHMDNDSSFSILGGSKLYFSQVGETIEEEEDEEAAGYQNVHISNEMQLKLKASHDKVNSFKYLQLGQTKIKKIRSICLETQPILEELDEYNTQYQEMDQSHHTFRLPKRDRVNSIDEECKSGPRSSVSGGVAAVVNNF